MEYFKILIPFIIVKYLNLKRFYFFTNQENYADKDVVLACLGSSKAMVVNSKIIENSAMKMGFYSYNLNKFS